MVKSLDEVIERLQYKADNIKAKLEPSYFTECIEYLKSLPRVEEEQEIRNKAIDKFAEELYNKSTNFKNIESDDYGMLHYEDIYETAEQMKGK